MTLVEAAADGAGDADDAVCATDTSGIVTMNTAVTVERKERASCILISRHYNSLNVGKMFTVTDCVSIESSVPVH